MHDGALPTTSVLAMLFQDAPAFPIPQGAALFTLPPVHIHTKTLTTVPQIINKLMDQLLEKTLCYWFMVREAWDPGAKDLEWWRRVPKMDTSLCGGNEWEGWRVMGTDLVASLKSPLSPKRRGMPSLSYMETDSVPWFWYQHWCQCQIEHIFLFRGSCNPVLFIQDYPF